MSITRLSCSIRSCVWVIDEIVAAVPQEGMIMGDLESRDAGVMWTKGNRAAQGGRNSPVRGGIGGNPLPLPQQNVSTFSILPIRRPYMVNSVFGYIDADVSQRLQNFLSGKSKEVEEVNSAERLSQRLVRKFHEKTGEIGITSTISRY